MLADLPRLKPEQVDAVLENLLEDPAVRAEFDRYLPHVSRLAAVNPKSMTALSCALSQVTRDQERAKRARRGARVLSSSVGLGRS